MKRLGALWIGNAALIAGWAWDLGYSVQGAREHAFAPPHLVVIAALLLTAAAAIRAYRHADDGWRPFLFWVAAVGAAGACAQLAYDLLLWRGVADGVAVTMATAGVLTGSSAVVFLTAIVTLVTITGLRRTDRPETPV